MKSAIKKTVKYLNKISSFWCANDQRKALKEYRIYEIENLMSHYKIDANKNEKILDFGFGDGFQSNFFKNKNFNVSAIDINKNLDIDSDCVNFLVYDGKRIPFDDKIFDIVFSSNVLEHLNNLSEIQSEIYRVLKDDGICIHILPSSSWRFWTICSSFVKYWYIDPRPHGEITNNSFFELVFFSRNFWKKSFQKYNFKILKLFSNNLFYTGNNLFGLKIGMKKRITLSKFLGSSCNIFILKKNI